MWNVINFKYITIFNTKHILRNNLLTSCTLIKVIENH